MKLFQKLNPTCLIKARNRRTPRSRTAAYLVASTLALAVSLVTPARADVNLNSGARSEFFREYKKGDYLQAIRVVETLDFSSDPETKDYYLGTCFNKLQNFEKAAIHFQKAIQLGSKIPEIHYSLGQALYASLQLKKARAAFQTSSQHRYKTGASLYYVGLIGQTLEDSTSATQAYEALLRLPEDPEKVKQAAEYQLGEIRLAAALAEQDPDAREEKLRSSALVSFQDAIKRDKTSAIAKEAEGKVREIEHLLDEGKLVSPKLQIRFSDDTKYDSNVVAKADQSILSVSNIGSLMVNNDLNLKYGWNPTRRLGLVPEVDVNHTIYSNQGEPLVYQNDNLNSTAALRGIFQHSYGVDSAASFLDLELNYVAQDWSQTHRYLFYSNYYNVILGERIPFFKFGSTRINLGFKLYANQNTDFNSIIPTGSLVQNLAISRVLSLSSLISYTNTLARNTNFSQINYRLVETLSALNFVEKFTGILTADFTLVDTGKQMAARGWEKNIRLTAVLTRPLFSSCYGNLNFTYNSNISMDLQNYNYSKFIGGLNLMFIL